MSSRVSMKSACKYFGYDARLREEANGLLSYGSVTLFQVLSTLQLCLSFP